jgi:titin
MYRLAAGKTGRFNWTNGWQVSFHQGFRVVFDAGSETPKDICPIAAPTAPRSVKATPSNRTVTLSWAPPTNTGRAPIKDYTIQRLNRGKWVTLPDGVNTARSFRVTGLTNGTRYSFRVIARNSRWPGAKSAVVRATPRTVPSAPRSLAAVGGDGLVALTWKAPASNGGAPIQRYLVQRLIRANHGWATIRSTTARSLRVTGLHNGTRYTFRVRAVNAAGHGEWSRTASAIAHAFRATMPR